ncbi:MAG: prepilin peptidase [Alphaproteobacteria bacterium]|nr:prepilin peptidase [Alphaproteobacteria bacterium]
MSVFFEWILLTLFPAAMIFAAVSDLTTMRIPNSIPLSLFSGFFLVSLWSGTPVLVLLQHLGTGFFLLFLGFVFFEMKWMGGGDAKLMASAALWFSPHDAVMFVLMSSIGGGLLTLLILSLREAPLPIFLLNFKWLYHLLYQTKKIPYGVAISVAGLWLYPVMPWIIGI